MALYLSRVCVWKPLQPCSASAKVGTLRLDVASPLTGLECETGGSQTEAKAWNVPSLGLYRVIEGCA